MKPVFVLKIFSILLLFVSLPAPTGLFHSSVSSHVMGVPVGPDFTMTANPQAQTIPSGATATSTITISSINGFAGTISLTTSPPPMCPSPYCGYWSIYPYSVTLASGGSDKAVLSFTGGAYNSPRTWNVTVFGSSGSLSHNVTVSFTVVPTSSNPDFSIAAYPSFLTIIQGLTADSTIILTSLQGFQGTVSLSAGVSCPYASLVCPQATINPSSVSLTANGTAKAILTVSTMKSTPSNTYQVVVTGTSGSLSHSVSVTARAVPHLNGDVDDDCKVDISDLAIVADQYGSAIGTPRWNPMADLNGDGRIDILDVAIVGGNFGRSC